MQAAENGNGNGKKPLKKRQPLSELQASVLETTHENGGIATFAQVLGSWAGGDLSEVERLRAKAAVWRCKTRLVARKLLRDIKSGFALTAAGAEYVEMMKRKTQASAQPVIATDADLAAYQRIMKADRNFDEYLVSLGRKRITVSEAMDGMNPRRIRPRHHAPLG
jgi:hypothetical protein